MQEHFKFMQELSFKEAKTLLNKLSLSSQNFKCKEIPVKEKWGETCFLHVIPRKTKDQHGTRLS